jgi:hypothetical protein
MPKFVRVDCFESTFTKSTIEIYEGIPHVKMVVDINKIVEAYPAALPAAIITRVPLSLGIQLDLIERKEDEEEEEEQLQFPGAIALKERIT